MVDVGAAQRERHPPARDPVPFGERRGERRRPRAFGDVVGVDEERLRQALRDMRPPAKTDSPWKRFSKKDSR